MARYTQKRKEDIGLSPNALVYRGNKKNNVSSLSFIRYNKDNVTEDILSNEKELFPLKNIPDSLWLKVVGLHDVDRIIDIASVFNIPTNIVSDILDPTIRPKVEEFDDGLFISLKIFHYNKKTKHLTAENMGIIIQENVLISFQESENDIFDSVQERLKKFHTKIRTAGSDYLAFSLIDVIIDSYIYIMELLGDKIEDVEQKLYGENIEKSILTTINLYKRELNYFRRHAKPAKEMIMNLVKLDSEVIRDENEIHFKELSDNIKEANEVSDSYREMLYDLMNMYHTIVSTKLNDIMKVLTIISVIFIPITFVAGVYGTNFEYFPEIKWKYGYFIMWGIMLVMVIAMIILFKKKKWF